MSPTNASVCQASVSRCPPVIRPDSQIVPGDEKTSGTIAQPATDGPYALHASQNVETTTSSQMTVPPLTSVIGLAPQTRACGYEKQQGQDAHVRRAGIMPSPVAVHGVEQRQAVDGQVAVEVVLGVEDQRHADQDRPDQAQAQHHPGPAGTSNGRVEGRCRHGKR